MYVLPAQLRGSLAAPYRIGVDTGGTFVDVVVVDAGGKAVAAKALTSPGAGIGPVLNALRRAADQVGVQVAALLRASSVLVFGTTAGLNAVLTRTGERVGLLTTRGHEDAILIGRVHQKVAGLTVAEMSNLAQLRKPAPLVPRWLIRGIPGRIDTGGKVVVELDRSAVLRAVEELAAAGCTHLAVCFLWSFKNDAHERLAAALISERLPGLGLSLSVDVAPVIGEYERAAATVVNAHIAATLNDQLNELETALRAEGFAGSVRVMQSAGGFSGVEEVSRRPVATLRSGPVGGVMAAEALGRDSNVISADMGGTSFDVGLIVNAVPELEPTPIVDRLHIALPSVRVRSVGSGGGSIVWLDEAGTMRIGPHSAGSDPGPACFRRGGVDPTVTDADLVLGRLRSGASADPELGLDPEAAYQAIDRVAEKLGIGTVKVAAGVVRIADARLADELRKATLEAGHDPRRFDLVAYGGAAPVHVGAFAPEAGVAAVVIPRLASVFSASGLATSRWREIVVTSGLMPAPLDVGPVSAMFAAMESAASSRAERAGVSHRLDLDRSIDLRYRRQTHVLTLSVGQGRVTRRLLDDVVERFEEVFARVFGHASTFASAGIEAVTFRVTAAGTESVQRPSGTPGDAHAQPGTRPVFFGEWLNTPVHEMDGLRSGTTVRGPAVIDGVGTTLVVHPGQHATVDEFGDVTLTWDAA